MMVMYILSPYSLSLTIMCTLLLIIFQSKSYILIDFLSSRHQLLSDHFIMLYNNVESWNIPEMAQFMHLLMYDFL